MRRKLLIIAGFLLLAATAVASKPETLEELKARAEAASNDQKPLLYAEVTHRDIEAANQLFVTGEVDKAQADIRDAVQYAEKARDAAVSRPQKLKETEIHLRKAEHRLNDIRRTLSFEDQPPVQEAADQIAAIRKQILDVMFAPKRKK